jgi:hypothetical protein
MKLSKGGKGGRISPIAHRAASKLPMEISMLTNKYGHENRRNATCNADPAKKHPTEKIRRTI